MAKKAKGDRVQVILECTEQKGTGVPGISRYITTKNRKNTTERLELKHDQEPQEHHRAFGAQEIQPLSETHDRSQGD